MSDRPQEFADWLRTAGKTTARLAREHGFQANTVEAALRRGLVRVEHRPQRIRAPLRVFYPVD